MTENRLSVLYWTGALAIIVLTTWVRYWFVATGQLGLSPDEAQYWDWSRTLQWSYYSKGPLIAYLNALGTAVFGPSELGVRIGAIIGAAFMQLAVLFWIGSMWRRIRTAFWTLVVLNSTALFLAGGLLMTTDNPLLLCWILGMVCLDRAVDKESVAAFVLLGVFLALGVMAKYTMLLFIPLALCAALWIRTTQELPMRFWSRLGKALGVGGILGLMPILIWNVVNGWVGLKHVLYRGALAGDKAKVFFKFQGFPEYLGSQFAVLTPWWFVFMFLGAGLVVRQLLGRSPQTEFAWLPRSSAILLTVFFWPVWLFFLLWSLHAKVEANWSAVAYPAGILLAAMAVERFIHRQPQPKWRFAWPIVAGLIFVALHLQAFIPFDGPKNPMHRLRGWQDLGQRVDVLMTDELGGPDKTFVFSDQYGVTAALSFYVPGQRRAFCVAGGRKMNQYDLWPGPDQNFENAVFVVKGEELSVSERVAALFETVDEPMTIATTQGRRAGQVFTVFLCRGYKGNWPIQEEKTY